MNFKTCFKNLILLITVAAYCASAPAYSAKKKKAKDNGGASSSAYSGTDNVKLPSAKRTYFYKIDPTVIAEVEIGSPQSLRKAVQALHRTNGEYAENERVLIEIATQIMQIAWPSQKVTWDSVSFPSDNLYLGAIDSVRNGIFDSSTGKSDFLSIILPALVILSPSVTQDSYDLCEQACKEALSYNPSSVLASYLLGVTYVKKNNFSGAEECFRTAYNSSEFSKEIAIAYARVLLHFEKYAETDKILASFSSSSDSSDIDVLCMNAYVSFAKRDLPLAEQYVARVLQQTPNNLEFVLFRAKILIEKNDYIHAVSLLDMYAKQNDTSIDYLVLRAKVQLDWSKNTTTATQTVERALQLYPDNTEALMLAARISSETDAPVAGKYADELCAKILASEPENTAAMRYALSGLIQRENWAAAYEVASKLANVQNPSADIIKNYVEVCIKLRRKSEAFDFAKKMQIQFPNDEEVLQAYVLAYAENGSRDLVLKYINSLLDSSSSKMKSYLYYRRSFLQLTEETVLADLRSSLISNPRNSDALFRLYQVYYSKNDYRKAQYYLRQVVAIKPNDSSIRRLNEALTQLIK